MIVAYFALILIIAQTLASPSSPSSSSSSSIRRRIRAGAVENLGPSSSNAEQGLPRYTSELPQDASYASHPLDLPDGNEEMSDDCPPEEAPSEIKLPTEDVRGKSLLYQFDMFFLYHKSWLQELVKTRLESLDLFQILINDGLTPLHSFENKYMNIPNRSIMDRLRWSGYQKELESLHSKRATVKDLRQVLNYYYGKFQRDEHLENLSERKSIQKWAKKSKEFVIQFHSDIRKIVYWTDLDSLSQPDKIIKYYNGQLQARQALNVAKQEAIDIHTHLDYSSW